MTGQQGDMRHQKRALGFVDSETRIEGVSTVGTTSSPASPSILLYTISQWVNNKIQLTYYLIQHVL